MKYLLHSAPEVNRHVSQCLFWCFSRSPMSTFKHLWLNSCLAQDLISFLGPAWSCYCLVTPGLLKDINGIEQRKGCYFFKPSRINCTVFTRIYKSCLCIHPGDADGKNLPRTMTLDDLGGSAPESLRHLSLECHCKWP